MLGVYPLLVTLASVVLWSDEPSPKEAYFVTAEVILSAIVGYVGVFLGHIRFTVLGKSVEKLLPVMIITLLAITTLPMTKELLGHRSFRFLQFIINVLETGYLGTLWVTWRDQRAKIREGLLPRRS